MDSPANLTSVIDVTPDPAFSEPPAQTVFETRIDVTGNVIANTRIAQTALNFAMAYEVIDSPVMADMASAELRNIVTKKKSLNEQRLAITRPLDESKKAIMELFSPALARLEEAEAWLKGKMDGFFALEDQKRKAEEARLAQIRREEQAAADAEAKRIRVEAQQRAEAEAVAARELQKKAEAEAAAAREQAANARRSSDMEAAKEAEKNALEIEERGRQEAAAAAERAAQVREEGELQAQQAAMTAAVLPAAIVASTKVLGAGRTLKWSAEVTDKMALIRHVAEHPDDENLLEVNETACNQLAKAKEDKLNIPGIRAVQNSIISSRARRGG